MNDGYRQNYWLSGNQLGSSINPTMAKKSHQKGSSNRTRNCKAENEVARSVRRESSRDLLETFPLTRRPFYQEKFIGSYKLEHVIIDALLKSELFLVLYKAFSNNVKNALQHFTWYGKPCSEGGNMWSDENVQTFLAISLKDILEKLSDKV